MVEVTLDSIGDALRSTDELGPFHLSSQIAESITGCPE